MLSRLARHFLFLSVLSSLAVVEPDPSQTPQPSQAPQSQDSQKSRKAAQAAAAAGIAAAAVGAALSGAEAAKAAAQGDQAKAAEEAAKMAAQLGQMAANIAALAANKKGKEQARAADPVNAPKVPAMESAQAQPAKESAKEETPQSSRSESMEVPELRESADPPPSNIPAALAQQIAQEPEGEGDEERFSKNFDSEIPDVIPVRAKLGYDESGVSGASNTAVTSYSAASLSGGQDGSSLSKESAALARETSRGFQENVVAPEGNSGEEFAANVTAPGGFNVQSFLGGIFGGDEAPSKAPSFALVGRDVEGPRKSNRHPELAETTGLNIFQYASLRYQRFAKLKGLPRVEEAPIALIAQ